MVRVGTAAAALAELPAAWENGLRTLMAQTLHTMSSANALMTQRVMAPPSNAEPSAAAALPFQTLDYLAGQRPYAITHRKALETETDKAPATAPAAKTWCGPSDWNASRNGTSSRS